MSLDLRKKSPVQASGGAGREKGNSGGQPGYKLQKVVKYRHGLQKFLELRVGSRAVAMELTQDTFERFLMAESAQKIECPKAFLFRIASNLAINHQRRERIYVLQPGESGDPAETVANDPSPEEWLQYGETQARFAAAYEALPVKYQEIFYLRRFSELSTEEIAQRYGISRRMVQKYLIKIMKHFQVRLREAGEVTVK